jgi:hypothetical protein
MLFAAVLIVVLVYRELNPEPPDVAGVARSPEVLAVRATAVPALDAAFTSLEPGRALGTSIDDNCYTLDEGTFLPSWRRVTCARTVTRYYGADGRSCEELLRTLRRLGWLSIPQRCDGESGYPEPSRVVAGATTRTFFKLRMSPRPLEPRHPSERRITASHSDTTVYLEYRGVELANLSARILRGPSHVLAITSRITYYDPLDTEYTLWGPV